MQASEPSIAGFRDYMTSQKGLEGSFSSTLPTESALPVNMVRTFDAEVAQTSNAASQNMILFGPLGRTSEEAEEDNILDTDTKLAMIISSLDEKTALRSSSQDVMEALISAKGSVRDACSLLRSSISMEPPAKRQKTSSAQKLLTDFLRQPVNNRTPETRDNSFTSAPNPPNEQKLGYPHRVVNIDSKKSEKSMVLYDPNQVSEFTPCTLVTSFLPSDLANELLQELLLEAEKFPAKGSKETRFRLFGGEKEVWSSHTSGFFVRKEGSLEQEWAEGKDGYLYNGISAETSGVRTYTSAMEKATALVEQKVNSLIKQRWETYGKKKFESQKSWSTNAAFVNCYDGGGENVGWHTDQLTYLGPMSTIAGLSLGVGREFGVRKVGATKTETSRVFKIWLPHNSLLIMHAGTQEEWKHCILPATAIAQHPTSLSKRISITYRCYRTSLTPQSTPRCKCPLPGILRAVINPKSPHVGRYFWTCQGGYRGLGEAREGCGWFEWAKFDEDGEFIK